MFWKKKQTEAKEPSPVEIIMNQIEQLSPGESLTYRVGETFGGDLAIVDLNPQYPDKGEKKYRMSTEKLVDGKPSGKRKPLWYYDNSKMLASWFIERHGVPFNGGLTG